MALLDILDSSMDELIEPVAPISAVAKKAKAAGAETGVGGFTPQTGAHHRQPIDVINATLEGRRRSGFASRSA